MIISDAILFPRVVSWENLLEAYRKAARGKRGKLAAASFEFGLADRLLDLQADLLAGSYQPGSYHHFVIHEPKRRLISAAPFRDRVVHHALCNIIEPLFEARFHPHSYANRVGKGTHRAVDQLQAYARQYRYVLRLDIRQHFPSLDHQILKDELFRVLPDEQIRWLIETILHSGEGVLRDEYDLVTFPGDSPLDTSRPRGLPIGNLTSQFWSNCYLNPLDWFVSRELGCAAYLRYVDDFALFSNNKKQLAQWRNRIIEFLAKLRLTLHTRSAQALPVSDGIPWLGFVVYPSHRRLKRRNVVQFQQRLEQNITYYQQGEISFAELDASVQGWINHVRYADTWGLRKHILGYRPISTPQAQI
ncbi:MAG: reverse transcriptase/maturase family protein [Chloroflexi bacterium]|nr:reverse transcriptase/maturase family protein [Chloroflexota bacterium]